MKKEDLNEKKATEPKEIIELDKEDIVIEDDHLERMRKQLKARKNLDVFTKAEEKTEEKVEEKNIQKELKASQKNNDKLKEELATLKKDIKKKEKELEKVVKENESIKNDLSLLKKNQKSSEKSIKDKEAIKEKISLLQKENKKLNSDLEKKEKSIALLKEKEKANLKELKSAIKEKDKALKGTEKEKENVIFERVNTKKLEDEVSGLYTELVNERLINEQKQNEAYINKINQLTLEINELKKGNVSNKTFNEKEVILDNSDVIEESSDIEINSPQTKSKLNSLRSLKNDLTSYIAKERKKYQDLLIEAKQRLDSSSDNLLEVYSKDYNALSLEFNEFLERKNNQLKDIEAREEEVIKSYMDLITNTTSLKDNLMDEVRILGERLSKVNKKLSLIRQKQSERGNVQRKLEETYQEVLMYHEVGEDLKSLTNNYQANKETIHNYNMELMELDNSDSIKAIHLKAQIDDLKANQEDLINHIDQVSEDLRRLSKSEVVDYYIKLLDSMDELNIKYIELRKESEVLKKQIDEKNLELEK